LRRIGFLGPGSRSTAATPDENVDAFVKGMRDLGYVEGKNLVMDWLFADGDYQRLAAFAAELVRSKPDLIVVYGTAGAQALQRETKTIPIVIAAALDPVGSGFATSLARPGGNITGLSALAVDLSQKHLELLTDMVPKLSRVAVLLNPRNSGHRILLTGVESAGKPLNIKIIAADTGTAAEIEHAYAAARRNGAGAVIIAADAFFAGAAPQIADASIRNRLPSIGIYSAHVTAGTLISYGQNIAELHQRAATYVDKILKGANPGDLPIEQPTKFELVVNLKTAKALGIKIPQAVLIRADRVIE
jgi:putative tryptophan/tyrosine transport system substrate-binding protein